MRQEADELTELLGGEPPASLPKRSPAYLLDLCGKQAEEDADEMLRLIEEEFEQTDAE